MIVGRHRSCDVILTDDTISGCHYFLFVKKESGNRLWVRTYAPWDVDSDIGPIWVRPLGLQKDSLRPVMI